MSVSIKTSKTCQVFFFIRINFLIFIIANYDIKAVIYED